MGSTDGLVMDASTLGSVRGENCMAEEESILVSPPTQDVAVHVRDYMRFTRLFKYGAFTCLIIGFIVLLILK